MTEELPYSIIFETSAIEDLKTFTKNLLKYLPLITKRVVEQLERHMEELKYFPQDNKIYWRAHNISIYKLVFQERFIVLYAIKGNEVHVLKCLRIYRKP